MTPLRSKLVLSFVLLAAGALTAKDVPRTNIEVVASSTSTTAPGWTTATTSTGEPRQILRVNIKAILSDERRVTLSCQKNFAWSRCKPLDAGSYSAELKRNSVLVYTRYLSGKEQRAITYSYAGEWETDPPSPPPP